MGNLSTWSRAALASTKSNMSVIFDNLLSRCIDYCVIIVIMSMTTIDVEFVLLIREVVARCAKMFRKCWMKESLRSFRIGMLTKMSQRST